MPRLMIPSAFVLASMALAAPLEAQAFCRGTPASSGYPVSATWIDSGGGSPEYLQQILGAAVYRWRVPTQDRYRDSDLNRVQRWIMPSVPRWESDWRPDARHAARLAITLFRNGDVRLGSLRSESGDRRFDESLETIGAEPMPGAPSFPALTSSIGGDSVVVLLHFGQAVEDAPVIRFAAEQDEAQLRIAFYKDPTVDRLREAEYHKNHSRGRLTTASQGARSYWGSLWGVLKFDVTSAGTVDPNSVEVIHAKNFEFGAALKRAIFAGSFSPAMSNCNRIAQSVIWSVGERGGG